MSKLSPEELAKLREQLASMTTVPDDIAKELVSVQPMPDIDLNELAKHPLWSSFVRRHFKDPDDE